MVFRNASRGQPAMEVFVLNLTNRHEASPFREVFKQSLKFRECGVRTIFSPPQASDRFLRGLTLWPSEFVAQRELHDTRLGQQAGVGSEAAGRLRKRSEQGCSHALSVKAREVRHVEHLPSKLQIVGFR